MLAVRIWILLSATLVAAGWILSVFHALNPTGYGIVFLISVLAVMGWQRKKKWRPRRRPAQVWCLFRNRFRRPAPFSFLFLAGLALLSGILYVPVPGDASMYRTPRVLHWLAAGQWHWIRTFDIRMNIANCGFEWITAPLVLLTHTDRLFFLINWISFLLLPGLVFTLFRRLEISSRVAWWWMWLLPAAFCYALQAGSLANDGMAAIYIMGAVIFALEAGSRGRANDLWLSMLAAALATGVKQTNLPLILLWLIAAWPAIRLLLKYPGRSVMIVFLSLLVSAAPLICLNLLHDCNWAGVPRHPGPDWTAWEKIQAGSPLWSFVGNLISLPVQTLAPPFFPVYQTWTGLMQHFEQTHWGVHFASFENFCKLPSFVSEQSAGLGFMVCLLLLLSLSWVWRRRWHRGPASDCGPDWQLCLLKWTPWGLLALFMTQVTSFESVRQLAPYYPFLLIVMLAPRELAMLVRRAWWQNFALLAMVVAAVILVIIPVRPLWPANTLFNYLATQYPNSNSIARAKSFYSGPKINQLARHAFQSSLPPGEAVIGYATDIRGLEPGLWRPFRRSVERVLPEDNRSRLEALGIHYVVVDADFLSLKDGSVESLMQRYNARLVDQLALPRGWKAPPIYVYLLQLN